MMYIDNRSKFDKAMIYGDVATIKKMVDDKELIVVRRHVKLAKKYNKELGGATDTGSAGNYKEMVTYLKSQCKCKWFL